MTLGVVTAAAGRDQIARHRLPTPCHWSHMVKGVRHGAAIGAAMAPSGEDAGPEALLALTLAHQLRPVDAVAGHGVS